MSLVRRKKPDGSIKDWVVSFRRNGKILVTHFKADQYEQALKHHEHLLKTLPPPKRHKQGGGTTGKIYIDHKPFKLNGCSLTMAETGVRCEKGSYCSHYDECLTEAAKRNWNGFKIETEKRRPKCSKQIILNLEKSG